MEGDRRRANVYRCQRAGSACRSKRRSIRPTQVRTEDKLVQFRARMARGCVDFRLSAATRNDLPSIRGTQGDGDTCRMALRPDRDLSLWRVYSLLTELRYQRWRGGSRLVSGQSCAGARDSRRVPEPTSNRAGNLLNGRGWKPDVRLYRPIEPCGGRGRTELHKADQTEFRKERRL